MTIRSFISIELPDELKRSVSVMTSSLRDAGADVTWVREANLHLTLRFLGYIEESRFMEIERVIKDAAARHAGFEVSLRGVGVFPVARRPRVIWIGLNGAGGIQALQQEVEAGLRFLGFKPEDRPFRAHLTIGRVKSPRGGLMLMRWIEPLGETDFGAVDVKGISLMKSDLGPAGPTYTRLAQGLLAG